MELDRSVSVVCARASGRSVRAVLSKAFLSWIALALLLGLAPASAQTSFAGKTITVLSGFGSGGAVDLWARLVAHHIGKHLPGRPNAVVQNMPGAGGLNALNHLYNVAPNDGTVMGITVGYTALAPITGAKRRPLRSDEAHLARQANRRDQHLHGAQRAAGEGEERR
jgi:hypothetical protein